MSRDKLPPHDLEAEAIVIGCFVDNPTLPDDGLSESTFYDVTHQTIFRARKDVIKEGKTPDIIAIHSKIKEWGKEKEIPPHLLGELVHKAAGISFTFARYVSDLQAIEIRRKILNQATFLASLAYDTASPIERITFDAESALEAIARIGKVNDTLPPIDDAIAEFPEDKEPDIELVYGLLHKGSKMVFGRGSKSYKTWLLLDLAISVSHGEPWLSLKTTKGKVLYLNFEIQAKQFRKRIRAVAREKSISLQRGNLSVWNLRGHAADFAVLLPEISRRIKNDSYALVIIDPIYKGMAGRDENKAGDISSLLNEIERLAVETGAAVAFGAHFSKGNQASKESIDRISGSSVFARDPDSIVVMTRHEEDDAFTIETTLRNFKSLEPFVVRWSYPLMRRDNDLDPRRLKQSKGRPSKYSTDQLLAALNGNPLNAKEWEEEVKRQTGMSHGTFTNLKNELLTVGKVTQTPDNKWKPSD